MKTQKAHATRKHAKYSSSSANRLVNCHGYLNLSKNAPPGVESPAAMEGTRAHECLEFIVKRYSNVKAAEALARKKWPDEMVDFCLVSAEEVFALRPSAGAKLLIETKATLKHLDKDAGGTLDYAWLEEWGQLVVIDFKYGYGLVEPCDSETKNENEQLMCYALSVAKAHDFEFESVKLAIIQPRIYTENGNITATHTTTIKRLRDFEKRYKGAIEASKKPDAPIKSGDWCKYCPAETICPEVSTNAMQKAGVLFDVKKAEVLATPDPKALTAKQLPGILDACDQLESWIDAVRVQAQVLAERGEKIAGRKLVQKRSTRSWLPEAEAAAKKKWGAKAYRTEFLSPAQLEKEFGKEAKDFTGEYTSNVSSGVTLVKESDKRPEVSSALAFDIDTK